MPTFDHRQAVAGAGVGIEVTLQDLARVPEEVATLSAVVRLTLEAFCRVLVTITPLVTMQPLERRLREVVASTGTVVASFCAEWRRTRGKGIRHDLGDPVLPGEVRPSITDFCHHAKLRRRTRALRWYVRRMGCVISAALRFAALRLWARSSSASCATAAPRI